MALGLFIEKSMIKVKSNFSFIICLISCGVLSRMRLYVTIKILRLNRELKMLFLWMQLETFSQ